MKKLLEILLIVFIIFPAEAKSKGHAHEIIEQMNYIDEKSVLYGKNNTGSPDLNLQASITAYLNNIKTMVANFIQISPDGSSSEGTFFLARPGKLRWQYNPPVPILIIVNNNKLIYYDYELNEVTYSNTDEVLGSFLTAEKINFKDQKVTIDKTLKADGIIRMNVLHPEKKQKMTLLFTESPLQLKKIEFFDDTAQITSVSFHEAKYNVELDRNLFILKNPRVFKTK
ncbi:MAG: outer membrane lipoprotein carrier protein LolA [Sphingobacteriia bacterium]|nr:outer membrane lipoprotein carrier protein LolA [Sphingobacteriia bacterium]